MTNQALATGPEFDYAAHAEVYIGRGVRNRPGLHFKGFDTAAEAIRYIMERPRAGGEISTLECDDERYGPAEIARLYHDSRYPLPRIVAEAPAVERSQIAVPVSRGPNRARPAETQPARTTQPAAPVAVHARHRYAIGDRLRVRNGGASLSRQAGHCRITFVLPHEGGQLLYRIKSELETFERVVAEVDLSPA